MKTLILAVATLCLVSPLALAQEHDHQAQGEKMHAQAGQEEMMKLHGKMQHMRDIMANVKTETDPQKRQQLLHEHLQLMRESMNMMRGMQNGMMAQGHMQHGDGEANKDERMAMMTHHMSMMEDMLRQMEAYSAAIREPDEK